MAALDRADLLAHLHEQLGFLVTSMTAMEHGNVTEAKRVATALRVLLHDTRTSHSLFGQLGVKDRLRFADSTDRANFEDRSPMSDGLEVVVVFSGGLVSMMVGGLSWLGYGPNSNPPMAHRSFEVWWTEPALEAGGVTMSRKKIVLGLANQDGGAHVDATLESAYFNLTRGGAGGYFGPASPDLELPERVDPASLTMANPVPAAVYQIGRELLTTVGSQITTGGDVVGPPSST
jgi:hypothetical protein